VVWPTWQHQSRRQRNCSTNSGGKLLKTNYQNLFLHQKRVSKVDPDTEFSMYVISSFIEIYNETIRDLLDPARTRNKLTFSKSRGLKGAISKRVSSVEEALSVVNVGIGARKTAATSQ
jgi:hypothetical protein